MKKLFLFILICLAIGSMAYAQDPGVRDTIIIDTVHVSNSNPGSVSVPIYVTSDDSVTFYNLPLRWSPSGIGVNPWEQMFYFPPLTSWSDNYDTLMFDDGYVRQFGICELMGDSLAHTPMYTGNARRHVWTMMFGIDPEVQNQLITLDTTYDDRNHSMKFGLADGLTEFRPVLRPGWIMIGDPTGIDDNPAVPTSFSLNQNYPNPFNPETNIDFSLPKEQNVVLMIYNVLGQNVRTLINDTYGAGTHTVRWDGKNDAGVNVPSGIYFYKMSTPQFSQTNKMLMLR